MKKYIAPETTTVNIRVENSIMSAVGRKDDPNMIDLDWDEEDY